MISGHQFVIRMNFKDNVQINLFIQWMDSVIVISISIVIFSKS